MLHRATLISRSTKDGWDVIHERVPLGKTYYVDLNSVTTAFCGDGEHSQAVSRQVVMAHDTPEGEGGGWMMLELLNVEADA